MLLLPTLLLLAACGVPAPPPAPATAPEILAAPELVELPMGGSPRTYFLYVPEGLDGPAPAVLAFHGGGKGGHGKGSELGRVLGLQQQADALGFVLITPSSWAGVWNDGRNAKQIPPPEIDDLAFVEAVIDDAAGRVALDRSRLFATGLSNGGMFVIRLACERTGWFAGYGAVNASLPVTQSCTPEGTVPIWMIAGTEDPLVPWAGGVVGTNRGHTLPVEETAAMWAKVNGCTGEPGVTELADAAPDDGTRVRRTDWTGCAAPTRLDAVVGMGHHWPGARIPNVPPWSGLPSAEYDAGAELATWFLGLPPRAPTAPEVSP